MKAIATPQCGQRRQSKTQSQSSLTRLQKRSRQVNQYKSKSRVQPNRQGPSKGRNVLIFKTCASKQRLNLLTRVQLKYALISARQTIHSFRKLLKIRLDLIKKVDDDEKELTCEQVCLLDLSIDDEACLDSIIKSKLDS